MDHTQNGPGSRREPGPDRFPDGQCTCGNHTIGDVPDAINIEGRWSVIPESKQTRFCGTPLRLFRLATAAASDFPKPCDSWTCRNCANRKAAELLRWATCMFHGCDYIYYSVLQSDEQEKGRLRERRDRLGGGQLRIPRGEDVRWFSGMPLGGYKSPLETDWKRLTPKEALMILAAVAMVLPGPDKPRFLGAWKPEKTKKDPEYVSCGPVGDRIWNEAIEPAVERINQAHDLEPDSWSLRTGPPQRISAEELRDTFNEAIREIREQPYPRQQNT